MRHQSEFEKGVAMRKILLAAVSAVALAGGSASAEQLATVTLGLLKLGAVTNVWVADREGIFKNHGLEVKLVDVPMVSQAIGVLQSKSVDIVLQIPGTAMMAKER